VIWIWKAAASIKAARRGGEEGMSDSETGQAMPRREDGAGDEIVQNVGGADVGVGRGVDRSKELTEQRRLGWKGAEGERQPGKGQGWKKCREGEGRGERVLAAAG
jgi:hypothetical protein